MSEVFRLYFGGDLFDHKDLIGNALLASYIEKGSKGRYECYLPQNLEQKDAKALDIRNNDLKQILECDVSLFNFDGAELDADTVVEFIFAKCLDVPSVIMRSDFRSSGEKDVDGEDWNLMCLFYPRTQVVQLSAIEYYQEAVNQGGYLSKTMDILYKRIASRLIKSLDKVRKEGSLFKSGRAQAETIYQWAATFPGEGFENLFGDSSHLKQIIAEKRKKGLI